jgi:hypothetical protein
MQTQVARATHMLQAEDSTPVTPNPAIGRNPEPLQSTPILTTYLPNIYIRGIFLYQGWAVIFCSGAKIPRGAGPRKKYSVLQKLPNIISDHNL